MPDITGTFIETGGGPIAGWRVEILRWDSSHGWLPHGVATTDAAGGFTAHVPIVGVLILTITQVQVRMVDHVGRVVYRSEFVLPLTGSYGLGTVSIHANNLRGYFATNQDPGGAVAHVSTDNSVQPLIDNAAAWEALHQAVAAANHEILLQLFFFDVTKVFLGFNPDPPAQGSPTQGARLEEDLIAARDTRGVSVRLLIRDHSPLPYPVHTADKVVDYFAAPAPSIEVRRYSTDVRLPMHAKFVVVDGAEGHLTASPLLQEYFDGPQHAIENPRRGPLSQVDYSRLFDPLVAMGGVAWPPPAVIVERFATGQFKNSIRVPIHDVGLRIRGSAVDALKETFFAHWNQVGAPGSSPLPSTPGPAPQSPVQIVRSLPGAVFPGLPDGETGILESYLRCFANATDYLYLENQYLTAHQIFDAIRLALSATPSLQVILLINVNVDIPLYQSWQTSRLIQLREGLSKDGTLDRLGVFTVWSHDNTVEPQKIIPTYVHSKVGIADDRWATVGSANLDGVSLMTGEHLAPVVQAPGLENRRATEVNATILDGLDGLGPSPVPRNLRRALWAEHLGLNGPADPALAARPNPGGWLSLWKARADAKVASLKGNPPVSDPCRALPWQPQTERSKYLAALGIDPRLFEVLEQYRGFDFFTGTWQ